MKRTISFLSILFLSASAWAQQPATFDVSDVSVGTKKIATTYLLAIGKWSDAGRWSASDQDASILSTEIHCYKEFAFCEEADAIYRYGQASVALNIFNIAGWNAKEMIAVDDDPPCVVRRLQVDFPAKRVTASTTLKDNPKNPLCANFSTRDTRTAFLGGLKEEQQKIPLTK
jgi:hypothetical protein